MPEHVLICCDVSVTGLSSIPPTSMTRLNPEGDLGLRPRAHQRSQGSVALETRVSRREVLCRLAVQERSAFEP